VQPDGGRAGAAVVQKAHRAGSRFGAVEGVGDVKHAAVGLVVGVADEQRAGCGRVLERFAAYGEFVVVTEDFSGGMGAASLSASLAASRCSAACWRRWREVLGFLVSGRWQERQEGQGKEGEGFFIGVPLGVCRIGGRMSRG